MTDVEVEYSDFRQAMHLNIEIVKTALHWDKAFYDDETVKALGLPSDHNVKLEEQQKKEKEFQQKQNAVQTVPQPTTPTR